ncbi:MAG: hypothetical protein OK449_10060 [Thaumarchaeota archaeon]|nr:hypothetical protein [Nitrososphaerota archaeon]
MEGKEPQLELEASMEGRHHPKRFLTIRNISIAMACLLFFQYVLGMATNLFVGFPTQTASVNPLDSIFTEGPYAVLVHFFAGLALGILSISTLILSARAKDRTLVILAVGGLGAILLAGESGIEFVLGWYSNDVFSFLMSFGFLLSFTFDFLLLWFASLRCAITQSLVVNRA